jgi:hypothetical protein|tara:strand:+ start:4939 stop:5343 length:405 start_codon:yes stop_codon:yes gene_type:complete
MIYQKRGMILVITLVILSLVTMVAITLFTLTREEIAISGNRRLHSVAKQAAHSGLSHFKSLGLHHHDIVDRGGRDGEVEIIPLTRLGKAWYKVRVESAAEEDTFSVISEGFTKKGERIISYSEVIATFRTIYDD